MANELVSRQMLLDENRKLVAEITALKRAKAESDEPAPKPSKEPPPDIVDADDSDDAEIGEDGKLHRVKKVEKPSASADDDFAFLFYNAGLRRRGKPPLTKAEFLVFNGR
jgi:hypothetical protein